MKNEMNWNFDGEGLFNRAVSMRENWNKLMAEICELNMCKRRLDSLQKAAVVWRFDDAPEELQALSTNCGDEDWLIELPPGMEKWIGWGWIAHTDSCHDPKEYAHPTKPGWKVLIGSHA